MVFVKNSDEGVFSPHFAAKLIIRAPLIPLIRRLRRHLPPMWGRLLLFSKSFYSHTRFRFIYIQKPANNTLAGLPYSFVMSVPKYFAEISARVPSSRSSSRAWLMAWRKESLLSPLGRGMATRAASSVRAAILS